MRVPQSCVIIAELDVKHRYSRGELFMLRGPQPRFGVVYAATYHILRYSSESKSVALTSYDLELPLISRDISMLGPPALSSHHLVSRCHRRLWAHIHTLVSQILLIWYSDTTKL